MKLWTSLKRHSLFLVGFYIAVFFVLTSMAGLVCTKGQDPLLNPNAIRLSDKLLKPFTHPSAALLELEPDKRPGLGMYILGTDAFGRDVFARMLQGAMVSLQVGFIAAGIAIAIGIILGALAGFYGGWIDTLIMRFVDVMLSFPSTFLILTIIALRPPSMANIMMVIGFTSWMGSALFVRAQFLSLREQDFVQSARALGVSPMSLMFRHMLPNAFAPLFITINLDIASAILAEASLSYLGFGVPPPAATWGNILADGKTYLFDAPHLTLIPGLAIFLTVLSFNLMGEGLKETLNPRSKTNYE